MSKGSKLPLTDIYHVQDMCWIFHMDLVNSYYNDNNSSLQIQSSNLKELDIAETSMKYRSWKHMCDLNSPIPSNPLPSLCCCWSGHLKVYKISRCLPSMNFTWEVTTGCTLPKWGSKPRKWHTWDWEIRIRHRWVAASSGWVLWGWQRQQVDQTTQVNRGLLEAGLWEERPIDTLVYFVLRGFGLTLLIIPSTYEL